MEMYWSAVATLKKRPEATVEVTMLVRPRVKRVSSRVMPSIMPPAAMAPPKHMAQMINQIVSSIPDMPRVAIKSLISALPASKFVLPKRKLMAPLMSVRE